MAGDPSTEARVLSDLLERIDKLTQHIIEIKGDMYRRSEWSQDAARIYDSISSVQSQLLTAVKETVLAFEKRMDRMEREYLSNESFDAYKSSHLKDSENDERRLLAVESAIKVLQSKIIHPALLTIGGTLFGAAGTWMVQHILTVLFPAPAGKP